MLHEVFHCPACKTDYRMRGEADYSTSRYYPDVKLCPPCGQREAFEGCFWKDLSDLHPKLIGLEGKRVRVEPPREYGRSTFTVGRSTGWRPVHLAMLGNARGSSDVISAKEVFDVVKVL